VTINRRQFVAQTTALAAVSAIPFAFAKAPMGGGTAVSSHRMKLGTFEITTLLDGFIDINPAFLCSAY
jgi:hypothetical protein